MSETKLGKITTTPKGEWSSATSYERLDIVQLKGTSWMAKRANTGVEPVEGDDWMLSAEGAPQIDDTTISAETPWSSKNTVDRFCPEITGEGNPVVLENCVEGYPLDVTASWGVQQEGSGTPHIEGYGANKFRWADEDVTLTNKGMTLAWTAETETFHLTGCSESTVYYPAFTMPGTCTWTQNIAGKTYTYSFVSSSTNGICYLSFTGLKSDGSSYDTLLRVPNNETKTYKVPDDVVSIGVVLYAYPKGADTDLTFKIQVEEGSTATEWTPYAANIRPFVGKDSIKVQGAGINRLDPSTFRLYTKKVYGLAISLDNDVIRFKGTVNNGITSGDKWRAQFRFIYISKPILPATSKVYWNYHIVDSTKPPVAFVNVRLDTTQEALAIDIDVLEGSELDFSIRVSCTLEPTTDYVPYSGSTATLSLPETIYAGSVETDGKVERDVFIEQFTGEEKWYCSSNPTWTDHFYVYSKVTTPYNSQKSNGVIFCDHFYAGKYSDTYNKGVISVSSDGSFNFVTPYDSLDEWVAYLKEQYAAGTPVTVVATPAAKRPTLTTTPATLPALSGANTITTDADTMTVTARKDPIKIIANLTDRISALEAAATEISEV